MARDTVTSWTVGLALMGSLMLAGLHAAAAAEPQSPDQVHMALRILASVYADMESKLPQQQFDRLPHETMEFVEGSGALRDAMQSEAGEYKAKVLSALDLSVKASRKVADVSRTHDAAQVRTALDALAASMRTLNGLFPESLRAEPGSVPPPQHNHPPQS